MKIAHRASFVSAETILFRCLLHDYFVNLGDCKMAEVIGLSVTH
ncbi:hypothetical protein Syncc8109_2672 [Synechococcus sp. WH 8109]|nr:hypothetical protein Syncc8109_2672 [Synechococcus sp. WH 8109]